MTKYPLDINPTSDVFVQYLFALRGHEHFLLSFVNAVLEDAGRPLAVSLTVQNPMNLERFAEDKRNVVDLKAIDQAGRTIEIEVQTINHPAFINRTLYYACRNYSEQLGKGNCYVRLKPVISIALTRFNLFLQLPRLHNVFYLMSKDFPDSILTDHLEMHYLELTDEKLRQFPQNSAELRSWLDFFFYANSKKEEQMEVLLDPTTVARNAYNTYRSFCQSDEMRVLAEMEEKKERDYHSLLAEAHIKGKEEGKAEGLAEGEARGKAEGLWEGKVKDLLLLLSYRFSPLEVAILEPQIRAVTSLEKLEALFVLALSAASFEEFAEGI